MDRLTDRLMDGPTKWGVETRNMRLKKSASVSTRKSFASDLCFDSLVITLFLLQTNAYVNAASYRQYRQKYFLKIDLDSEL